MRRTLRRWVYASAAFAVSVALMWLAHVDTWDAYWASEQSLQHLRRQVASPPVALNVTPKSDATLYVPTLVQVLDHLPGMSAQARLWPTLQQALARQRLQLLSFRPADDSMVAPLASQAVALRLRGRFDDWARAWSGMNEGSPVWSIDRVHIHPQVDSAAVEIDVLLRVWLRAGPDGPKAWQGQAVAVFHEVARPVKVFVSTQSADQLAAAGVLTQELMAEGSAAKSEILDSPDPTHGSWTRLRLMGIWEEAGTRYAILTFGSHWVRAQVGQRVSLEGHRLQAIGDQAVSLSLGQGPVQVLNFEKGPR